MNQSPVRLKLEDLSVGSSGSGVILRTLGLLGGGEVALNLLLERTEILGGG